MIDFEQLIQKALRAKENAYAPYSNFHVGAAVLGKSGTIYTGCNIENAAYPVTNCAERTALFKAVSEGEKEFLALAVVSDSENYVSPCGMCRQALAEFCGSDFQILMCRSNGDYKIMTLEELLPESFGF